jgi:hypothetical protein
MHQLNLSTHIYSMVDMSSCPAVKYSEDEHGALMVFWREKDWANTGAWLNAVCCWAKVHFPN